MCRHFLGKSAELSGLIGASTYSPFRSVSRPHTRERMQPSLILSLLALSSAMQSNDGQPSRIKLAMVRLPQYFHNGLERNPILDIVTSFVVSRRV